MGCATSKPKVCEHCRGPLSKAAAPPSRSYSMHVHHLPQRPGDTYHVVALTSSTLGTIKLDRAHTAHFNIREDEKNRADEIRNRVSEAKSWSNMIEQKIPKIASQTPAPEPAQTPSCQPETINAWELMQGLEDNCNATTAIEPPDHQRSSSFHVSGDEKSDQSPESMAVNSDTEPISGEVVGELPPDTPSKIETETPESMAVDSDTEPISTSGEVIGELPPDNPSNIETEEQDDVVRSWKKDKLIVYFTSLRGIRKTHEDCCHVRTILRELGVKVDERDVSMHSVFKEELKGLLRDEHSAATAGGGGRLPKVFVGRTYIGGAEEIRRMHESGRLEKAVGGCEKVTDNGGGDCEACGDVRFVPCRTCSGSCKVYYQGECEDEYGEYVEDEYGFQRCPDCNENGLIRCPICCHD